VIPPEKEAEVLRLHHAEHWKIGTIATQLGLHHTTVRRVLAQQGVEAARHTGRPSIADPFVPLIVETLAKYPRLTASRLFGMAHARGYRGSEDHFRAVVARHRPRPPAEAFARLRTLPGEQAQVDWGHFGTLPVGQARRPLMAFVMVLSWSRRIFLRFYPGAAMGMFLRGHVDAFAAFGGVPRELRYDNLKSAVLERAGDAIRFHPTLLELAAWYRFAPHPCRPFRGNEKGRVERAIRYVRDSFFAARAFNDLGDLNAQADAWCDGIAADRRCPEDRTRTVRECFVEERTRLLPLPGDAFAAIERVAVSIGKTPYARFDGNDYSVPPAHVRRTLEVVATMDAVRLLAGDAVVATHARSWDRGQTVEDPAHVAALIASRPQAGTHRGVDRLTRAVPASATLLEAVAERGGNLGSTVARLLSLLDQEGAEALGVAVGEALAKGTPHVGAVRLILETARRARGAAPPVAVELPSDPRVRDLVVTPHALARYDLLRGTKETSDE
jgi:transposase